MPSRKDVSLNVFGRLLVLYPVSKDSHGHYRWLCLCKCGKEKTVSLASLSTGKVKSCGCLFKEVLIKNNKKLKVKHGMRNHKLYSIWKGMMDRCYNIKNSSYKDYGGRGIYVHYKWHSVKNFIEDMVCKPPKKSLDRIDNNWCYSAQNCRWATSKQQANNRRQRSKK